MKKAFLLCAVLALALPCPAVEAGTSYGTGVTVRSVTPISDILAGPSSFIGKTVKIRGLVVDVCSARGCWMELAGDGPRQALRVKVEDGVIVFPADATGRRAVAQGKVRLQTLDRQRYVAWKKHLAEETGTAFDETAIDDGPFQLVEIAGTGAAIGD